MPTVILQSCNIVVTFSKNTIKLFYHITNMSKSGIEKIFTIDEKDETMYVSNIGKINVVENGAINILKNTMDNIGTELIIKSYDNLELYDRERMVYGIISDFSSFCGKGVTIKFSEDEFKKLETTIVFDKSVKEKTITEKLS